jgi:dihydrolipoamide dehydrogenase
MPLGAIQGGTVDENSFDCVVIGSGPGGYVAAIRASQLGLRTAVVERDGVGGVCLNWGCIPTKALLKSAEVYQTLMHASQFGLEVQGATFNLNAIVDRSRSVVDRMTKGVQFLLKKNKVELIKGYARFAGPNTITVDGERKRILTVKNAVIATGARPRSFPNLPVDGERIITSRQALELRHLPKRLLVVGAGAIGVEFAYYFAALGSEVTLVEMMENILPIEDQDISLQLAKSLSRLGIQIRTKASVEFLERSGESVRAQWKIGDQSEEWTGDYCLVAVGVQGNVEDLGLETVGITPEKSFIKVDNYYRTTAPHIYAIGDVNGPPWLAHVASHEGIIAAEHLAGAPTHVLDYSSVPSCTYSQPQAASIGITEKQARDQAFKFRIGRFPFLASGKAVAAGETDGFVKVIIDEESGEVLGVHIIHPEATELIGEAAIIRSHEGVAASVFTTMHAHPTLGEAIMEAMGDAIGRAIHI